jgi:hypothetical protein
MFKLLLCIGAMYASFAMFKLLDGTVKVTDAPTAGQEMTADHRAKLSQLIDFMGAAGYSEHDCRRGLEASEWAPEAASDWILSSEWILSNCQADTSPEVELLRRWAKDNTNAEADYLRAYEMCLNNMGAGDDVVRRSVSGCILHNCSNKPFS